MADNDLHYNAIYPQVSTTEAEKPAPDSDSYSGMNPAPGAGSNAPSYPGNNSAPGAGGAGANAPAPGGSGSNGPSSGGSNSNGPGASNSGTPGPGSPSSGAPGSDRPINPSPPQDPKPPQLPGAPDFPSRPWLPFYSAYPGYPANPAQSYGQVRFLNASTGSFPVSVSIDGSSYFSGIDFASLSAYDWISDGFHTVTVRSASGLRSTLLQQTFPFSAGQKVTLVLTDAADGSLDLIRVIDTGCSNLPSNSACFRFANMTWPGSNLDLMLGNETVFRNISYQSVSSYKQAVAGNYPFTVVAASGYAFIRELPLIILGAGGVYVTGHEAILTFSASITAGNDYTAYLIGNTWSNASLQVLLAQD